VVEGAKTVMRRCPIALGTLGLLSFAMPKTPVFIWNATASAPVGLYRVVSAATIARGDLVLVRAPLEVARVAVARGYLAPGVPLVKSIAALNGDRICGDALRVFVNGGEVAIRLSQDGQGRALSGWQGCKTLAGDQVLLLNGSVLHSFDGRYFGPVSRSAIIGTLRPLWTR
jgi:conjugative transfer signal peptidase TraF